MEKKIKICHFTSVHKVFDDRIYLKECISLANAGFEVYLVAPDTKSAIINKVNIIGVDNNYNSRLKRILLFTRKIYLTALNVDADIYHFHDAELLYFGNKLKQKGKKVIYDSHEDLPRQILSKHWINSYIARFISRIVEKYENKIVRKIDFCITATPVIRNRFSKIVSHVVDINNFPKAQELATRVVWENKKNELCYIGGIFKIRGIVEILDILDKYVLNLAGTYSPEELRDELMKHKNWIRVKDYGFVNREKIKEILMNSKIGMVTLYPTKSFIDSLPVKLFEYMSASIPVIASNFPLWKEIVEDNNCGICVDPMKTNEIAYAIDYLMKNPEIAKKMGENGRRAVLDRFNWEIEEKKLIEVYRNLSGLNNQN